MIIRAVKYKSEETTTRHLIKLSVKTRKCIVGHRLIKGETLLPSFVEK